MRSSVVIYHLGVHLYKHNSVPEFTHKRLLYNMLLDLLLQHVICLFPTAIIFDIMYGNNVCVLMNKSNTKSNNTGNEKWKCDIILEMLDCLYGLNGCGLSIDKARQCLTYAATI